MNFISFIDFLILPVYISLLYLLIKSRAIKYRENGLDKFYITAFFLHMLGAVLYAMVIQFYYGYGDSFGFFTGSNFITNICKEDFTLKYLFYDSDQLSNLYLSTQTENEVVGNVMSSNANLLVMKFSAALSFICFNRYLIITLFFGLFSFAGIWRLFITFNEILGGKAKRILAITVLYTPSIWFWGSGLIKDSICIGCVGFVVNSLYKIFINKKFSLLDVFFLLLGFYGLFVIKSYIAVALALAIVVFSVHYFVVTRKSAIEKWLFTIVIAILSVTIFSFVLQSYISSLIEDSKGAVDTLKNAYESLDAAGEAGSGFTGKSIDFTAGGILLSSPVTIFTTLYRPFIWETRNIMMLFSSIESFLALFAFLYLLVKAKAKFFVYVFTNHFILFAFVFVMALSMIIGLTTFNFGTMVRYRIPVLPFYSFMLIAVYIKYMENKKTDVVLTLEK